MNIPKLRKQKTSKKYHGITIEDDYAWIHQSNILEVLKDEKKLNPEVKKYLEDENKYTEEKLKDTKKLQKKLFYEIKGRIKLDDETLPYKDKRYEYWSKYSSEGNYERRLRRKIGEGNEIEEFWNGDDEAKGKKFFSVGDLTPSNNDKLLAYSLDLKGSEYYSIFIRNIANKKIVSDEIEETSGSIIFSPDDKYLYYSKLDNLHRPRQIYRHAIGTSSKEDTLIYDEKDEGFTCGISLSSDEKFFFIDTSDHITSEIYYFKAFEQNPELKLFKKRKFNIMYSIDSWKNYFYIHTNENAEDFKICRCKIDNINGIEDYIPAKPETIIGGMLPLENWIIRSETSDALTKIFIKNLNTDKEYELKISDEPVYNPGAGLMQKDRNTSKLYISYDSPKSPTKTFIYDIETDRKKKVKEMEIPSGHNPNNYVVERRTCESHDGKKIPITIMYHKKTKLDGSANVLLYGYGSYGNSVRPGFSSSRLSLINRDIIFAICHIRGGQEKGRKFWDEGKLLNKKNTFEDYIACAKYLIKNKFTSKGKIIGLGGSAGGLLMGAVVNQEPELFLGMIMAVPFVDPLTTNLDHSLPLTVGEFNEFGNAKENEDHFKYILSYAPYNNIKSQNYPHLLVTTSLSDSRVLFDEPAKFVAKLREYKTDKNLLLLKTEMSAGHAGRSGRDAAIEEIALDYSFALKIAGKNKFLNILENIKSILTSKK